MDTYQNNFVECFSKLGDPFLSKYKRQVIVLALLKLASGGFGGPRARHNSFMPHLFFFTEFTARKRVI
jgi:hypothetical protein